MAAGEVATAGPAIVVGRERRLSLAEPVIFVLSIAAALAFWELISRTGVISQKDLPAMSTSFRELWSMLQTSHFWWSFGDTVRGWALGLFFATAVAVPVGIALGSSDFAASAFRIPIEFMRPIPSAALIPVLFLTLGREGRSGGRDLTGRHLPPVPCRCGQRPPRPSARAPRRARPAARPSTRATGAPRC